MWLLLQCWRRRSVTALTGRQHRAAPALLFAAVLLAYLTLQCLQHRATAAPSHCSCLQWCSHPTFPAPASSVIEAFTTQASYCCWQVVTHFVIFTCLWFFVGFWSSDSDNNSGWLNTKLAKCSYGATIQGWSCFVRCSQGRVLMDAEWSISQYCKMPNYRIFLIFLHFPLNIPW